jgi:hypothetical protein
MAPVKGAIRLAASLRSPVVMVMMMVVMMVMRLCTGNRANRECNSGDGGQSESKFSHEITPWAGLLVSNRWRSRTRLQINGRPLGSVTP